MKFRKCKIRVLYNAANKESFEDFSSRFKERWKLVPESDVLLSLDSII